LSSLTTIGPCGGFNSFYFQFKISAKWALFSEPVTYILDMANGITMRRHLILSPEFCFKSNSVNSIHFRKNRKSECLLPSPSKTSILHHTRLSLLFNNLELLK